MLSPCAVHRSGIRTAQQLRSHSRLSRAVQHAPTRSRSLTLGVVSRAKEVQDERAPSICSQRDSIDAARRCISGDADVLYATPLPH